ncbi:hypothetical protein HDU98_001417 [Podochytrium sp. JEL0797]|nr:hypothetical protein HDU98_001417 [Podochytrium sp. JEL0797]
MSSDGAQRYREEKKQKKEKDGYELLRIKKQYQKLLKEEGYDPASINATPDSSAKNDKALHSTKGSGVQKRLSNSKYPGKPVPGPGQKKTTPFHKLEQKRAAEERERKEEKEKEQKEKDEKREAQLKYFKERKKTHNFLSRKTNKGQPVLSNQIDMILSKRVSTKAKCFKNNLSRKSAELQMPPKKVGPLAEESTTPTAPHTKSNPSESFHAAPASETRSSRSLNTAGSPSASSELLRESMSNILLGSTEQDANSCFQMAENLLFGRNGCGVDEKKAVGMLKRASFRLDGHDLAQSVLGFCYEFGLGVDCDGKFAENMYIAAAMKGEGLAITRLSFLRRYGRPNVKIDRVEAEEWIKRVTEVGPTAVSWLTKIATEFANSNNKTPAFAAVIYALGVCFHDGIAVPLNADQAVRYYKRSADIGQPRARGILAYCYGEGFGVEKDEELAFLLYLEASSEGELVSMYNLAHCFEEGIGVEKDLDEAVLWYSKAAALGSCYAQNSLGFMFEEGVGVERNEARAAYWYKLSAEQGYPWAQCNLGFCLQNGLGIEENETLGAYWYQLAALQGHSRAQHNLGHAYQYGVGVEKDEAMAVEWYRRSASAGNAFALHSLGYCYQNGIGCEVNEEKAVKLYNKSALYGHSPAQLSLGCCYRNGVGVEVNEKMAFKWIKLSANGGNDLAQNTIGHLFEDGIGTRPDIKKAIRWYKESAEQGNVWAMTNLAMIYLEGANGIRPKLKEAVRLLRAAAEQDHVRAQAKLAACLLNGIGCRENKHEAFEWFTQAADGGSVVALFFLGQCYERGDGCSQEIGHAIECYTKAAAFGDEKASDRLIFLVANPSVLDGMFEHGYIAPAA